MSADPTPPDAHGRASTSTAAWRARLAANLEAVRTRIGRAEAASGREPGCVRLVAVTKKVEPRVARALVELGVRDLGENRADGLAEKVAALADLPVRWHFLGHLQRNKVRRILPHLHALHSLDSERLVGVLGTAGPPADFRAYVQVKWTDEGAKTGGAPDEVADLVRAARGAGLALAGLMAMGMAEDPERTDRIFASTAALADELPAAAFVDGRPLLSMGMSGDLEIAIRNGADVVRVGSDLFVGLPLDERGRLTGADAPHESPRGGSEETLP